MRRGWIRRVRRVVDGPVYGRLAAVYDRVMDHVDYEAWADYLVQLFDAYGRNIRRVVDGGCGTGSMVCALEKRGYRVAGFDQSWEMIRRAREKTRAPLWQGDVRDISVRRKWDAFLCLYDTMQYLTLEEMGGVFVDVRDILVGGGLVVFDVVTEEHVLRYWSDYVESVASDGWEVVRRSWYERRKRWQHTEFEMVSLVEKRVYREHHRQRVYRLDELERVTKRSGLELVGRFRDFTLKPADETSDRVHFVLRRGSL